MEAGLASFSYRVRPSIRIKQTIKKDAHINYIMRFFSLNFGYDCVI